MTELEYKKEVRRIMDYAISGGSLVLPQEDLRYLVYACDENLIEGVSIQRMASGRIIAESRRNVYLTIKGIQFVEELEQPSKKTDFARSVSIADALLSIVSRLGPLGKAFQKLLDLFGNIG